MRGNLWQPTNVNEIRAILQSTDSTITLRGSGNSSINAPFNAEGGIIDLSSMKKMEWDLERNVVRVEPGVTVSELCHQALVRGLWPYVVPMMSQATLGGSLSVNADGVNPYKQGSIGKYVKSFELLLASGDKLEVSFLQDELFSSVIGGLGLLGVVTNITIQLQPIDSDTLLVQHFVADSLSDMISIFDKQAVSADYLVGWIDGYAEGKQSGRGVVISGTYADKHEVERAQASSRGSNVSGSVSSIQEILSPIINRGGMKAANSRYYNLSMRSREEPLQPMPLLAFHSQFHPRYYPLHIMRRKREHFFQPFVPAGAARNILPGLLASSQRAGFIPFRCILRRHKKEIFDLSYQLNGFSLELAYVVKPEEHAQWMELMEKLHEDVIQGEGRFYHAKDVALNGLSYKRSIGGEAVQHFKDLKCEYDPGGRFLSSLYQRLLV